MEEATASGEAAWEVTWILTGAWTEGIVFPPRTSAGRKADRTAPVRSENMDGRSAAEAMAGRSDSPETEEESPESRLPTSDSGNRFGRSDSLTTEADNPDRESFKSFSPEAENRSGRYS